MLTRPHTPLVIAHRGASHDAPEHTWLAHREAIRQGADSIEVDLRFSRDGVLVCAHDKAVDRISTRASRVADLTLAELKSLDVGSWFNATFPDRARPEYEGARIVTLAEHLDAQLATRGELRLHAEMKEPASYGGRMEEALVTALDERGASDCREVVVETFDATSLRRVKRLADGLSTCLLWERLEPALLAGRMPPWVDISGPSVFAVQLRPGLVRAAHSRGHPVHPWTTDSDDEIDALLDLGVDGIVTNRPAAARRRIDVRSAA